MPTTLTQGWELGKGGLVGFCSLFELGSTSFAGTAVAKAGRSAGAQLIAVTATPSEVGTGNIVAAKGGPCSRVLTRSDRSEIQSLNPYGLASESQMLVGLSL